MRVRTSVLAVAVTAAAVAGAWPTTAAERPAGDPELGTLIAGEESYVRGTHVWTDYAYDDRGPDTDGLPGGDATYPANPYPGNTADLVQLQLSRTASGALSATALLETLVPGAEAVVGVGLDTDADPTTGAPSVPGGQWRNREGLGLERLLVLRTDGSGALLGWSGSQWKQLSGLAPSVDRVRNTVSATVGALRPGTATWNAVGLVGMQDEAGGSWVDGGQPVYDLAYVRAEDPTGEIAVALREQVPQLGFVPYQDKDQADVLAGALPAHRAVADVAFGTTRSVEPPTRQGFNAFLYHSRVPVPEGVQQEPRRYDGPYMPYAVWIPPNLPASPPLLVFLHGSSQYQNVNLVHFNNPQGLGLASAYDVPAVVIFPNGRTIGWTTPLADRDALDAIRDAFARPALDVDRDRVVLSGVSSGGHGTYHLASRYPELFTGGYSLVGGGTNALENLTNVPFRASNGALDPLVDVRVWRRSTDALIAAGTVDFRSVLVHNRSHDGPLAEGNCYYLDLLSRDRVRDPSLVRFTSPVATPERTALGVHPTGAYWVSGMRPRDAAAPASVSAESRARPARTVVDDAIREVGENVTHTADFCGEHPDLRGGNDWSIEGRSFTTTDRPRTNALTVEVRNLAAATVDVARAGLRTDRPLTVTTTGDGPGALTLAGAWRDVRITRDGKAVPAVRTRTGGVVLGGDLSGTHTWTVARR